MKSIIVIISSVVVGAIFGAVVVAYEFGGDHYFNRFVDSTRPHEDEIADGAVAMLVGDSTHRFDVMPVMATGQHVFTIKNIGDADLMLREGESTCQCTVGKLDDGVLKPGESTEVTLEWTPKTPSDEFRHTAIIQTNDPRQPKISLSVEGRVITDSRISPTSINFGDMTVTETRTASFKVFGFINDNVKIARMKFLYEEYNDYFEYQVRDLTPEEIAAEPNSKSGVLVTVTLKPGMPLGDFNQTIRFETNRENAKPQEVPMTGRIVGEITFLALGAKFNSRNRVLTIGLVKSTEGATAKLHLVTKGEHANDVTFTIDETTLPVGLQVELGEPKPLGGGKSMLHPILLTIPKDAPPVNHIADDAAKIVIHTTHPTDKKVSFYVNYAIE